MIDVSGQWIDIQYDYVKGWDVRKAKQEAAYRKAASVKLWAALKAQKKAARLARRAA